MLSGTKAQSRAKSTHHPLVPRYTQWEANLEMPFKYINQANVSMFMSTIQGLNRNREVCFVQKKRNKKLFVQRKAFSGNMLSHLSISLSLSHTLSLSLLLTLSLSLSLSLFFSLSLSLSLSVSVCVYTEHPVCGGASVQRPEPLQNSPG